MYSGVSTTAGPCPCPPLVLRTVARPRSICSIWVNCFCRRSGISPLFITKAISAPAESRPGSMLHLRWAQIALMVLSTAFTGDLPGRARRRGQDARLAGEDPPRRGDHAEHAPGDCPRGAVEPDAVGDGVAGAGGLPRGHLRRLG